MPKSSPLALDRSFAALPARRTVAAIADTAMRWCDADFPPRVRTTRAIMERTRYSQPVVDYALDCLFAGLNAESLTAAIAGELGTLEALDGFVSRPGRPDAIARPVGRVVIVASDTTIGVALIPALFALCAHCEVVVRDRSDALVRTFAETLAEERPDVAARLHVTTQASHDDPAWLAELARADAVVVFGGDEALRGLRLHTAAECRFIAYGHRTSAAYLAREALSDATAVRALAEGAARDALLYDGEGCLSSHAVFVERDGAIDFAAFNREIVAACRRIAVEFPMGALSASHRTIAYRDAARFRSAQGSGTVTWSEEGSFLVITDPPHAEPPPLVARTLALYRVDAPVEFLAFVQTHDVPLEAVAVAPLPPRDDVVEALLASATARIARVGVLQAPSFAGEHGGIGRISPFVRWVTRDT
jgi:hypothetical protein